MKRVSNRHVFDMFSENNMLILKIIRTQLRTYPYVIPQNKLKHSQKFRALKYGS